MDTYRIGVSIILANGVSPVLAIIGKDLLGLATNVKAIERNFAGWGTALAGVGSILAGSAILGTMTKLVEKTKDFQDELIKIQRLGGETGKMAADGTLSKRAFEMSKTIPMKVEDLLKIPGDTTSIIGTEHAMETWEPLARYAWVSKRNNGDHGGGSKNDLRDLIRAGEMTGRIYGADGQIDPQKLTQFINDITKVTAATHGMVNPQTVMGLAQQGGPALRGLTEDGFLTMLVQSQAMGGHRAGTAYLSLWQQMAGGHMTKGTAQGLQDQGFLKESEWSSEGGHVQISEEASKRLMQMISKDPLTFAEAINKRLQEKGITDPAEQMREVMRITGRQTTQRFTAEEVVAFQQMKAEIERLKLGMSVRQSQDLYADKSISGNMDALSNEWHNLMIAIGGPESQNFIKILQTMTSAINSITGTVNKLSPETIDGILKVITGIGAGLVVLGGILTAALVSTFISAPVAIGAAVAALGVAFAAVVALNWGAVTGIFSGIGSAISAFIDQIAALYDRAKGLITAVPNGLGIDKGGSHTSPGKTGMPAKPIMFTPGTNEPRMQQASFSLNVDGRDLAQSVIDHLESIYGMPTGAPAPDGISSPFSVDHQYGA